jgi:hypothetical protein
VSTCLGQLFSTVGQVFLTVKFPDRCSVLPKDGYLSDEGPSDIPGVLATRRRET